MWKLLFVSVGAVSLAITILWINGAQQANAAVRCTYEYNDETHQEERVCRYYPDPTATPTKAKPTAKPTQARPTAVPTRVKPTPRPPTVRPTAKPPTRVPTRVRNTPIPTRVRPTPRPACNGRWTFDGVDWECVRTSRRPTATPEPTATPRRPTATPVSSRATATAVKTRQQIRPSPPPPTPRPTSTPTPIPTQSVTLVEPTPETYPEEQPARKVPTQSTVPVLKKIPDTTPNEPPPPPTTTATPEEEDCNWWDVPCQIRKWGKKGVVVYAPDGGAMVIPPPTDTPTPTATPDPNATATPTATPRPTRTPLPDCKDTPAGKKAPGLCDCLEIEGCTTDSIGSEAVISLVVTAIAEKPTPTPTATPTPEPTATPVPPTPTPTPKPDCTGTLTESDIERLMADDDVDYNHFLAVVQCWARQHGY